MTGQQGQGRVDALCSAARVSRASFYRGWAWREPDLEEMAVRDAIQRLALAHKHYGYRRIGAMLRRDVGAGHGPTAFPPSPCAAP